MKPIKDTTQLQISAIEKEKEADARKNETAEDQAAA